MHRLKQQIASPSNPEELFSKDYLIPSSKEKHRDIDFSDEVLLTLIQYVGMNYLPTFQKLSRSWFSRLNLLFDQMCESMEKKFQQSYRDYLVVERTKTVITQTEFGHQKGIRIDRLIEVSLKEDSPDVQRNHSKTFKIENAYRYKHMDIWGNLPDDHARKPSRTHSSMSIRSARKMHRTESVVFRPNQDPRRVERTKSIVYRNCYRFDIARQRTKERQTWIHLTEGMPGAKIPGYA